MQDEALAAESVRKSKVGEARNIFKCEACFERSEGTEERGLFHCSGINLIKNEISGGDAVRGNTRTHPEHDG